MTKQDAAMPCPFCGSADVRHTDLDYRDFVMCSNCGAGADSVDTKPEKTPLEVWNTRTALTQQGEPVAQPDWLLKTTQDLAYSIRRRCFPEVPQFEVLDDLAGVISQIDNMTCGMERKSAQPVAPHECKTEAEKLTYAAGWWKALEVNRVQPVAPLTDGEVCKAFGDKSRIDFARALLEAQYVIPVAHGIKEVK